MTDSSLSFPVPSEPIRKVRALKMVAIAVTVLAVIGVAGIGAVAWATRSFSQRYEGRLLPGTTIGDVNVSGMTRHEAIAAVRHTFRPQLHRRIKLTFGKQSWITTPRRLGASTNTTEVVDRAFAATEEQSFTDRLEMRFMEAKVGFRTRVGFHYPVRRAHEMVSEIAGKLDRDAVDASLDYSTGYIKITPDRPGLKILTAQTTTALHRAMRRGAGAVAVSHRVVQPEVTADAYSQVLLVRQDQQQLYLYEDGKITHSWVVAVGQPQYPTPTGVFEVTEKRFMPTWINPAPDTWGADMPLEIGPGPDNPLGLRALNWSASGIRFHGTENLASLGSPASHGCVRLANSDVIGLYDLVDVGTPIVSTWG